MGKTILFITPQLPYPPVSGGIIISNKMVDFLSENYNLILLCQLKLKEDLKNESEFLRIYGKRLKVYKSAPISSDIYRRSLLNLLKSYVRNVPLTVYRNSNDKIKKYLLELLKSEKIDCVLVDHYIAFQFIEEFLEYLKERKIKILLHEHNAEYMIWERYSKLEHNFIKRLFIEIEARRIKNYEKKICELSDKVLCVTPDDVSSLVKLGVSEDKFDVIMSVGDEKLLYKEDLKFESTEEALLFIGTLSWEANIDGITWFIENVWKDLKKEYPSLRFYIVGKNPPERLKKRCLMDQDIIFTGFIEDLEPYYKRCRVFISPIRFGSGIKIKNINAMYRGIPMVTTSIGVEGINGEDGRHFYIADDKHSFKEKISILLENKDKWYDISMNSRALVREKYTWDVVLKKLKKIIDND
ncbi:MAG: glycosyltransferase [Candidatus Micrarchaeia archaeon]